jgi:hypothetical protein
MAGLIATPVSKITLLDFLLRCDKNLNILHNRTCRVAFAPAAAAASAVVRI